MSDLLVSERRIKPIQDAVDAGNWKQALQQCEKWQKKGERSDRFLVSTNIARDGYLLTHLAGHSSPCPTQSARSRIVPSRR